LLELYAGAGNLTRGFIVDGWSVIPTDRVAPRKPPPNFVTGNVERVVRTFPNPFDAIVLDPPRQGAAEAIDSIIRLAPKKIVYVSCDPATLARDAEKLIAAGYTADGAWPIDLMPQTSHVEVVLRLVKT